MTWTPVVEWLRPASVETLALLVDASLKGSVVLLASLGLVRWLRRASAARRHLVLLLAILSFLAIPVLSVTLPRWAVLPAKAAAEAPADTPVTAPGPATIGRATTEPPAGWSGAAAPDRSQPPRGTGHPALPVAVAAVWLVGVALLALRTVVGKLRLRRLCADSEPLRGRGWTDLVRTPAWLTVELARSRSEIMPMTWGVVRAHVLLPHGAAGWPAEARRAVLFHEIAHLVRLDPFTQSLARLACTLFWFNPLLWMALRRLGAEQEKACDDVAAARLGNAPDYAQHVLDVVAGVGKNAAVSLPASALARPSALEQRMRAILDPSLRRDRVVPGVLILSVCLGLSAVVPVSMLAPRPGGEERPATSGGATGSERSVARKRDGMGRTALHLAARDGDVRTLTRLLAEGSALDATDDEGRTPLHLAAGNGRFGAVAALLDAGSDLSVRDLEGRTPLHLAARNGHPDVVEQLLAAGGSAHSVDFEGRSPLQSVASTGGARLVDLLLEAAAPTVRSEG